MATSKRIDIQLLVPEQWQSIRAQVEDSYEVVPVPAQPGLHQASGSREVRKDGGRGPAAVELMASGRDAHILDAHKGTPASRESMNMTIDLRRNLIKARDLAPIVLVNTSYVWAWELREGIEGAEAEREMVKAVREVLAEDGRSGQVLIQSRAAQPVNAYSMVGVDAVGAELPHVAIDAERADRNGSDPFIEPLDRDRARELAEGDDEAKGEE